MLIKSILTATIFAWTASFGSASAGEHLSIMFGIMAQPMTASELAETSGMDDKVLTIQAPGLEFAIVFDCCLIPAAEFGILTAETRSRGIVVGD